LSGTPCSAEEGKPSGLAREKAFTAPARGKHEERTSKGAKEATKRKVAGCSESSYKYLNSSRAFDPGG